MATGLFARFDAKAVEIGQERFAVDLAIAVIPAGLGDVWIAGLTGWRLPQRISTGRSTSAGRLTGANLVEDVRTIRSYVPESRSRGQLDRQVGLLFQAFDGTHWITTARADVRRVGHGGRGTSCSTRRFHASRGRPSVPRRLRQDVAVGPASTASSPGTTRRTWRTSRTASPTSGTANCTTGRSPAYDGVTPVAASIDPFFFHWTPTGRSPIRTRGPRSPILPRQPIITRGPITP